MGDTPDKAGIIDNGLYVSGITLGSVILAESLRKTFGKDRTIGERIDGVLRGALAGMLVAAAGSGLVNQNPIGKQANDMIFGGMFTMGLVG